MALGEPTKAETIYELLGKQNQTTPRAGGFIPNWQPPYQAPAKRCTCRTCPCCGGQIPTVAPYQPQTTPWINIGIDPNRYSGQVSPKPGDVGTFTVNG